MKTQLSRCTGFYQTQLSQRWPCRFYIVTYKSFHALGRVENCYVSPGGQKKRRPARPDYAGTQYSNVLEIAH
ncbi:hypothetical protein D3C84_883930 [compost metagenome]